MKRSFGTLDDAYHQVALREEHRRRVDEVRRRWYTSVVIGLVSFGAAALPLLLGEPAWNDFAGGVVEGLKQVAAAASVAAGTIVLIQLVVQLLRRRRRLPTIDHVNQLKEEMQRTYTAALADTWLNPKFLSRK